MINYELKLPSATKKTRDQIAREWVIDKAKRPSSDGYYEEFKKKIMEARKKDEALAKAKEKSRMETTLERIDRINYQYGNAKEKPKHLDNKNIETWEDSIEKIDKAIAKKPKKFKEPTSPVEIDFSLAPMQTAGLWSTVKDSSLYKLLDNPRVLGMELGHEGIMEVINLMQNLALKRGGRVK